MSVSVDNQAGAMTFACHACGQTTRFQPVLGRLHKCLRCGFVTYAVTGPIDFNEIYDTGYFTGAGDYPDYLGQEDSLRRSMRRHLEQMRHFKAPGGSLLEVGCAYGLFLDEARAHFDVVTGIDICSGPVGYARNTLGLDATVGDVAEFDFSGRRFDAICLWDTIEHLPRPDAYLAKIADLLSDEGMLFLTTGDIGSMNARLRGGGWRQIHPPSHLQYFSTRTIATLLDRIGLQVVGFETAAYYHTLYNILATLRMTNKPLGRAANLILSAVREDRARRMGLWINLHDIMFVAARLRR